MNTMSILVTVICCIGIILYEMLNTFKTSEKYENIDNAKKGNFTTEFKMNINMKLL